MRLPLTPAESLAFLRAIEAATAVDDLAALRKELRLAHGGEGRLEFLEVMISARALQLAGRGGVTGHPLRAAG